MMNIKKMILTIDFLEYDYLRLNSKKNNINIMATKKFKTNLKSLFDLFETTDDLIDFLSKKNVFDEEFIKDITNSKYLVYLNKIGLSINEIKEKLQYEIGYNTKNNKISVDITKNDIFSYLDSDDDLFIKMKNYIKNEEYEKAQILKKYFDTIDLKFNF
jgi:hypothetical protein